MTPTALTVAALTARAARLFASRPLVELDADGGRRAHRLGEVARDALSFGRGLRALGLPAGTAVAALLGNHRAHLEAQLGVASAGLALHALSPRHPVEALARALRRAGDRVMLADAASLDLARALCAEAGIPHLVVTHETDREGELAWSNVRARGEAAPPFDPPGEDDPAMISEAVLRPGHLRAVTVTHRAAVLHAMACATVDGLGLGRRDVILPAMPLYHANGCGLPLVTALVGATLVLQSLDADADQLREALSREGVTFAAGVSSAWAGLAEAIAARPEGPALPRGLRLMAGGNAPPTALVEALRGHGAEVLHVYGMTETGPLATACLGDSAQGHPVPLMELRVVDANGRALEVGGDGEGEVQLRGPWVASAYLEDGATPDRWTDDAWLRTGDLGRYDEGGALRLTGRIKPMIRCGGEWVDAEALERAARAHPEVVEASVRCVAHPRLVEQPEVRAVVREGARLDAEALRSYLVAWWPQGAAPPMVVEVRGS
ncbi:MAG: AMP-binding protein [Polyangiales bacterium]